MFYFGIAWRLFRFFGIIGLKKVGKLTREFLICDKILLTSLRFSIIIISVPREEKSPSWSRAHDWKSCRRPKPSRGFESLLLRHIVIKKTGFYPSFFVMQAII